MGGELLQVLPRDERAGRAPPVHRHDRDDPFVRREAGRLDVQEGGPGPELGVDPPMLPFGQVVPEPGGIPVGERPLARRERRPEPVGSDSGGGWGGVGEPAQRGPVAHPAPPQLRLGGRADPGEVDERGPEEPRAVPAPVDHGPSHYADDGAEGRGRGSALSTGSVPERGNQNLHRGPELEDPHVRRPLAVQRGPVLRLEHPRVVRVPDKADDGPVVVLFVGEYAFARVGRDRIRREEVERRRRRGGGRGISIIGAGAGGSVRRIHATTRRAGAAGPERRHGGKDGRARSKPWRTARPLAVLSGVSKKETTRVLLNCQV